MEESYVRTHNARLSRFAPPIFSAVSPTQRGVVNECGFLLFVSALELRVHPEHLPHEVVLQRANDALNYIARMQHFSPIPPIPISSLGLREAMVLASRLNTYFTSRPWQVLRPQPFFPGCGWVDDATGDVLVDHTLFEVKAGERQFRGTDLRQLLCYCALSFSAKTYDIETVCLINPRFGTFFQDDIETLCQKVAGLSAAEVLGEIVNYIAEPFSRYTTG